MSEIPVKLTPIMPSGVRPPAAKEDDIIERRTLRDYYIILRERLWVALPLALTAAIGLALYQSRELPQYRATAKLQFDKEENVINKNKEVWTNEVTNDFQFNTFLSLIGTDRIRNLVIAALTPEQEKILQRPYLKNLPPGASPPSAASLVSPPIIGSQRGNLIVNISVNHREPEAAKLLANLYVDRFKYYLTHQTDSKTESSLAKLETLASDLKERTRVSDEKLLSFMRENQLGSNLDAQTNIVRDNFEKANNAFNAVRLNRLGLDDQLAQIKRYQDEKLDLLEISAISSHGNIRSLRDARDAAVREQTKLIDRGYMEKHPTLMAATNALALAEQQLQEAIQLAIADLKTTRANVVANEATYQKVYDEEEKNIQKLRDLSVTYKSLADEAANNRRSYNEVLNRLSEVRLQPQISPVPVSILDEAQTPTAPFTPDPARITKTAIGVGLLVFLGVAVGLSFVDDRIKSAWDVETFINATLLGIIPDLGTVKDEDKYRLTLGDSQSAGVEPFLGLYSSVKIHSKLDFPKSLLVTSTVPGEGKTLVSCNLAGSFARHGRRTLIIDCDLRRPMLHRHFNKSNDTGLIAWFDSGAPLDDSLISNPHLGITAIGENLDLITAGGRSKSPTQFLESVAFAQLVERLKKHYDLIVIDSPPMGAVTDALLIANRADEVLYVCRFNRAYRKHIRLYIKALRQGKHEVLGIALNGLSPRRIEYYSHYRYYRSYKKYYGTES